MTVSTHQYQAFLLGDTEIPLSVLGGQITLDESNAPHVRGSVSLAMPGEWVEDSSFGGLLLGDDLLPGDDVLPDAGTVIPAWEPSPDTLLGLDPRHDARIRIDVTATVQGRPGVTERSFDLAVREREISHAAGEVSLTVASDEAYLNDYAPLTDDDTPFALSNSLRDVVDYVLNEVIPGASIEAVPSGDADVRPLWQVTNLHTNPEIVNTYGFGTGQGASAVQRVTFGSTAAIRWTTDSGTSNLIAQPSEDAFRVRAGTWYVFSALVRSQISRNVYAAIQWYAGGGAAPMQTVYGSPVSSPTADWTPVFVVARAPQGAEFMRPFVNTRGNGAGEFQYMRRPMVHEGRRYVEPFSGESADDTDYEYAWAESTHGSPSIRTPLRETADPDALTWYAGQSALDFLKPLLQAAGFRLVCDETRTWTLRDENYTAPGSIDIRHGVNLIDGTDSINRDEGLWFDARVTRYTWTDRDGIEQERVDSYALQTPYKRLTTVDIAAPYPGPGRSEYAVRRAQGRGREVTATVVADWNAHAEQNAAIRLEDAPTQIGATMSVRFDLTTDEMTITTRTTEIVEDAWLLQPDAAWTSGSVGESWLEVA